MKQISINLTPRTKIVEAAVGGIALAWFMACLLSWIIQTTAITKISYPSSQSAFVLLLFLAFSSIFAIAISKALREGFYGLYTLAAFNIFWVIFLALSFYYGLPQITSFFFNGGIICLIQIMISYTTTIFTLTDTDTLNLNRNTAIIIGATPFIAALLFLVGNYIIEMGETQMVLNTNQTIVIASLLIGITIAYVSYILHSHS
jgi:hypothetical protein